DVPPGFAVGPPDSPQAPSEPQGGAMMPMPQGQNEAPPAPAGPGPEDTAPQPAPAPDADQQGAAPGAPMQQAALDAPASATPPRPSRNWWSNRNTARCRKSPPTDVARSTSTRVRRVTPPRPKERRRASPAWSQGAAFPTEGW